MEVPLLLSEHEIETGQQCRREMALHQNKRTSGLRGANPKGGLRSAKPSGTIYYGGYREQANPGPQKDANDMSLSYVARFFQFLPNAIPGF